MTHLHRSAWALALALVLFGCDRHHKASHPPAPVSVITDPVHVTRTGSKYHKAGCQYLDRTDAIESREDAIHQGLTPCSVCNPAAPAAPPKITMVYVTKTGDAYHKLGCRSLGRSRRIESRDEAIHQGLKACGICGG